MALGYKRRTARPNQAGEATPEAENNSGPAAEAGAAEAAVQASPEAENNSGPDGEAAAGKEAAGKEPEEHKHSLEIRRAAAGRALTRTENAAISAIKTREKRKATWEAAKKLADRHIDAAKAHTETKLAAAINERNARLGATIGDRFPGKTAEEIIELIERVAE